MELKKLKCPECGANFESDEKVSFCSHCGAKLFFDDGTKNINYNYNYKTEDVAKIREIEVNRELELNKRQELSRDGIKFALGVILLIAFFVILFMSIYNKSKSQEEELQSIVNEIYNDINAENYDSALIKAQSLYLTDVWSSEQEEKWNSTRESLIQLIEEKMKK